MWKPSFLLLAATVAWAQDSAFDAPVLGWVFDARNALLRPILGVPGAATFGEPLVTEFPLRRAAVNPAGDHALAVDEHGVLLVRLKPAESRRIALDPVGPIDHLAWSPSGKSALVVSTESRRAIVLGGLPDEAAVQRELTIELPFTALSVSDEGALAIANSTGVTVYPRDSDPWQHGQADVFAIAFAPQSSDLAVASKTGNRIQVIQNREVAVTAGENEGISSPAAVRFSGDGKSLLIAAGSSVAFLTRESLAITALPCACDARTLEPLAPGSYRVNDDAGPIWMLLTSGSENRLLFVPPPVAPEGL